MSAIQSREESPPHFTVEEYLSFEEQATEKHEYSNGRVYNMSGVSRRHNTIALEVASTVRNHLRGGSCQVFISDVKLNISAIGDEIFYYPDVMVTCDPRDREHDHHIRFPKLIIEVISPSTERIDRREKRFAYLQVETLEEYLIVEQDRPVATIYRREQNWLGENVATNVTLCSIGLSIDLGSIFGSLLS